MELTEAHFFVLSIADEYMPGPEIDDLLYGVHIEAGYKDERVTVFEPLAPDEARRITLELFDAGCLEVTVVEGDHGGEDRRQFASAEAKVWLDDPLTWDRRAGERRPAFTELSLTPAGREVFLRATDQFGEEIAGRYELARELVEEFERSEPEFWAAHLKWPEDLGRWTDGGFKGSRPQHPEWPKRPAA